MILAYLNPEYKIAAILLTILLVNALYNYQGFVWFQNEVLHIPSVSIIRVIMTLLLYYGAMVFKIILLVKESNKLCRT
jgi:hypothetical protein